MTKSKAVIIFLCNVLLGFVLAVNANATESDSKIDIEGLKSLAQRSCASYGADGSKIASWIKEYIIDYMKSYAGYKTTHKRDIVHFINQNKDYMTCSSSNGRNFMMAAFEDRGFNQLFNQLFYEMLVNEDDESYLVDPNAVSYTGTGGQPETVLDYIQTVKNEPGRTQGYLEQVAEVEELIISVGAKRFHQLPKATQQRYLDNKPK